MPEITFEAGASLVIAFRELHPDKPRSDVQLWARLEVEVNAADVPEVGAAPYALDLSDEGRVLIGKAEFRVWARMAEDAPIGRGRLVFPFAPGAPVYVVPEPV